MKKESTYYLYKHCCGGLRIMEERETWMGDKKNGDHKQQEFKCFWPEDIISRWLSALCVEYTYDISHSESCYMACRFPENYKGKQPEKFA